MPTSTPYTTLPPITTPNDLDRSLLDSLLLEGTELQQAISLVNRIVHSSTLETPIKRYIKQLGAVLKRTSAEIALLQKEVNEARELLRVRRERKNGKYVAIVGKFVFNKKEILELVKKAENEVLKRKIKKRQTTKAIAPEIEEEEDEYIKKDSSESKSDCIIVASSRSKSRREG
jgi:vacuolar-type H+-ATPase subunit I/STV1